MSEHTDLFEDALNPLECIEDVLAAQNWQFDRMNEDELIVQIAGRACKYRLYFVWQDDMNALQMCCQFDMNIIDNNGAEASSALRMMNENLWMGHFDLPRDTNVPVFRYTSVFKNKNRDELTMALQDVVDIALVQCERFQPVFQLLAVSNDICDAQLSLALMDTVGES